RPEEPSHVPNRRGTRPLGNRAPHIQRRCLLLDRYMLRWAYARYAICVRDHCGAEPTSHSEPTGIVGAVRRGTRGPAPDATAFGPERPPGPARGRIGGGARRSAAARLSDPTRAAHGSRRLARSFPALLDGPRRCARTPSRSDGAGTKEGDESMSNREKYEPG